MSMDPKISESWEKLGKGKTDINWMAAEFKKANKTCGLELLGEGTGGLSEISQQLKSCSDKAVFGLVKVKFYDEMATKKGTPYVKFIYFRFLGSKVSVMTKGFLTPRLGSIDDSFPVKHLSYDIDENLTKFDQKSIANDFLRVSDNKVDASTFDFGPNQIFNSQSEKVVNNNKKPQNQAPAKSKPQQPKEEPKKEPKKPKPEPEPLPNNDDNDAKEDNSAQNQEQQEQQEQQQQEEQQDNNNNDNNNYGDSYGNDDNNNNDNNDNNDDNNGGDDNNNEYQNNQDDESQ